jgi:hypothetical protein
LSVTILNELKNCSVACTNIEPGVLGWVVLTAWFTAVKKKDKSQLLITAAGSAGLDENV